METLPQVNHPDLLVGFNRADDAGVYRLTDELALVQTVDFFPPIVDDPYWFGQIAAANALSDIYAMGGRPLTALNIVGFPSARMPESVLTEILRGGCEKITEAGAVVVGGHSIKDNELKYGLACSGIVHPKKIITNAGSRPGDRLYLTKPLGTGLITTGIKRSAVSLELEQAVTTQMAQLNRDGAELMVESGAHAATDVTGFGLLGHAYEMAAASGVTICFDSAALPLMPQVRELAHAKMIPGGAGANRDFLNGRVKMAAGIDPDLEAVLYDPQTSGGLLISLAEAASAALEAGAAERGVTIWCVGRVTGKGPFPLVVD